MTLRLPTFIVFLLGALCHMKQFLCTPTNPQKMALRYLLLQMKEKKLGE